MELKLKKLLKTLKLNESSISMVLGIIVVIIAGTLIVKYLKTDRGSIPQELLSGVNSIEVSTKTHKVTKGENLWNIAVKYYGDGFKWVDIATENKLPNAGVIEVGQELVIPDVKENAVATTSDKSTIQKEANTITNPITSTTYETVKGDSLWKIALRAYGDGYQWIKIAKENKITKPNLIHSGNILIIPR